jgi:hypothetical protein
MPSVSARREAGSSFQSAVQSEQVSTMPRGRLVEAGIPIAQLDFCDADTLPGFPLDVERGAELEHIDPRGLVS